MPIAFRDHTPAGLTSATRTGSSSIVAGGPRAGEMGGGLWGKSCTCVRAGSTSAPERVAGQRAALRRLQGRACAGRLGTATVYLADDLKHEGKVAMHRLVARGQGALQALTDRTRSARYGLLVGYFTGPSAVSITNAASAAQRRGDGFNSSRTSSAVVPLNIPLCPFFASWYAATARRTTGCSSSVKSMTVI